MKLKSYRLRRQEKHPTRSGVTVSILDSEHGISILEMAVVLPVLLGIFGIVINLICYLYNAWFLYFNAINQAVIFAPHAADVGEIEERVRDMITLGGYRLNPDSVTVSTSTDVPNKLITITVNADYDLIFPIPGITDMSITASGVGFYSG